MVVGETKSKVFSTSWDEARQKDPAKNVVDHAQDAVAEVAIDMVHAPEDIAKYLTGTDQVFGQRRSWSHIGEGLTLKNNPVTRTMNSANHAVYGGIDLLTGGLPHHIFNRALGLEIEYFVPPPATLKEGMKRFVFAVTLIAGGVRMSAPNINGYKTIQRANSYQKVASKKLPVKRKVVEPRRSMRVDHALPVEVKSFSRGISEIDLGQFHGFSSGKQSIITF